MQDASANLRKGTSEGVLYILLLINSSGEYPPLGNTSMASLQRSDHKIRL